jgi:mannitol-1-phosphate 5-dehydrogenase
MKAVVYGGGNIGRGFLGQLLFESGYETVFIDVNCALIDQLNSDHSYPIKIVCNDYQHEITIRNVRAVHSGNAAEEIAAADIMFTSAGVNVLPHIAQNIAEGIRQRQGRGLDIIICENLLHADKQLKELIGKYMEVPDNIGFVESSVGRMVPIMNDEMHEGNILRVWVEPFCTLPVDGAAFKNAIPAIKHLLPSVPFEYYIQSKLYLHNMGHAVAAYFGLKRGYTYIWEAMADAEIYGIAEGAVRSSAEALSKEHNKPLDEVMEYAYDLISRFQNRYLGDTCERVGRDARRKLAIDDRLLGAVALCNKHKLPTECIKRGIIEALDYL